MFRKLGDALRRFMYGRYGGDQLGTALMVLGLVLCILGAFVWNVLSALAWIVLIFYSFRVFSKNIPRRRQENAWFLRTTAPFRDRQHRYFRCPSCKQQMRVPRGKGRIQVTCRSCGATFEEKS